MTSVTDQSSGAKFSDVIKIEEEAIRSHVDEVVLSWYADQVESFASILRESSSVTSSLSLVQ